MKKKGRGLSFDQKREKMLKIFHSTKNVFNYEEIQKLSTKVGIPFPIVKQILNSLKADSLVQSDKIGAGVFYWSFPSQAHQILKNRLEIILKQIESTKQQISNIKKQFSLNEQGRQLTIQRQQQLEQLNIYYSEQNNLKKIVQEMIKYDPQRVELLKKQNNQLKQYINIETDNLQQIRKYIKKNQIGINNVQIQQQYGLPIDIDYIE